MFVVYIVREIEIIILRSIGLFFVFFCYICCVVCILENSGRV